MQIAIPIVIVLIVVAALLVFLGRGARQLRHQREAEVHGTPTETLRVRVPEGQDPAAYVAALRREGYSSVTELEPEGEEVVISCHQAKDRERERVRAILGQAPLDLDGTAEGGREVRFTDE